MKIRITEEAEQDLSDGFWFYERQTPGLGDYFRSALIADIDSLAFFAGIHEEVFGYHRSLSNRFPFGIYYQVDNETVTVIAVLDCRLRPSWIRRRLQS